MIAELWNNTIHRLTFTLRVCQPDSSGKGVETGGCGVPQDLPALNRDLKRFFEENGEKYPVWQEHEKEAGKYLK